MGKFWSEAKLYVQHTYLQFDFGIAVAINMAHHFIFNKMIKIQDITTGVARGEADQHDTKFHFMDN
jgi:hypothetical protein